jgi:hypothetical protein
MEAIGEGADGMPGRAAVPGLRAALLGSVPASGRPASAGSGTAVADTSSSDGGAAARFTACGVPGHIQKCQTRLR